jgi:hypothetical protein
MVVDTFSGIVETISVDVIGVVIGVIVGVGVGVVGVSDWFEVFGNASNETFLHTSLSISLECPWGIITQLPF